MKQQNEETVSKMEQTFAKFGMEQDLKMLNSTKSNSPVLKVYRNPKETFLKGGYMNG